MAEPKATHNLEQLRMIDRACVSFEDDLLAGKTPSIEVFLTGLSIPDASEMLRQLLSIELEHSGKRSSLNRDSYLERFPGFGNVVAAVFDAHERERDTIENASGPVADVITVRCPHCRDAINACSDSEWTEITCTVCGNSFSLLAADAKGNENVPPLSAIGHFEIVERLGVGGFGTVWKAKDTKLGRQVAIKIPRAHSRSKSEDDRFLREARAAASLNHPNIVTLHEVGRHEDLAYIVSDYIEGVTLCDWVASTHPTRRDAVAVLAKIALALAHAHRANVVHRDLKPANIIIDAHGEPHVMDFGLARRPTDEVTITLEGQVMGTPAYMSPEQARGLGHEADARSDVYSLGVMLYELISGELPFRGEARMLLHQVIHEEPKSPRRLNWNISKDLETIVLKCLEKQPSRRYGSAKEFSDELNRFLANEPIKTRPVGIFTRAWKWISRNRAATLALGMLLFLAIAGPLVAIQQNRLATSLNNLQLTTAESLDAEKKARLAADEATLSVKRAEAAARRELDRAERARDQSEKVLQLLVGTFETTSPYRDGRNVTVLEALRRIPDQVNGSLKYQPEVAGRLLLAVGRCMHGLHLFEEAVPVLRLAKVNCNRAFGAKHFISTECDCQLGHCLVVLGKPEEAVSCFENAFAVRSAELGQAAPGTVQSALGLAFAYMSNGEPDRAAKLLENHVGAHEESFFATFRLVEAYVQQGQPELARRIADKAAQSIDTNDIHQVGNLASALLVSGAPRRAIPFFEKAMNVAEAHGATSRPDLIYFIARLANAYSVVGDTAHAIELREKEVAIARESWGASCNHALDTSQILSDLYKKEGRLGDALELQTSTLAALEVELASNPSDFVTLVKNVYWRYQLQDTSRLLNKVPGNPDKQPIAVQLSTLSETRAITNHAEMQGLNALVGHLLNTGRVNQDERIAAQKIAKLLVNYAKSARPADVWWCLETHSKSCEVLDDIDQAIATQREALTTRADCPLFSYFRLIQLAANKASSESVDTAIEFVIARLMQTNSSQPEQLVSSLSGVALLLFENRLSEPAKKLAKRAFEIGDERIGPDNAHSQRALQLSEQEPEGLGELGYDLQFDSAKTRELVIPPVHKLRLLAGTNQRVVFRVLRCGGIQNVYLNSRQNYGDSDCLCVQVVFNAIPGFKKLGISNPWQELLGCLVECEGKVELRDDQVRIVLTDVASQLRLLPEDDPKSQSEATPAHSVR